MVVSSITIVLVVCVYFFISYSTLATATLNITPLWESNLTDQNCHLTSTGSNKTSKESVQWTLIGGERHDCSVFITTKNKAVISVTILSGQLHDTENLFFNRLYISDFDSSHYKYIVSQGKHTSCFVTILHANISLHFRGDITLQLNEIDKVDTNNTSTFDQYDNIELNSECNETDEGNEYHSYNHIIHCKYQKADYTWSFYDLGPNIYATKCDFQCPSNCSTTLIDRAVIYHCTGSNQHLNSSKAYIVLPNNVTKLTLNFNELTSITTPIFHSINSFSSQIEALNLKGNKLRNLHADVFSHLNNLTVLILWENQLKELTSGIFNHFPNLKALDLGWNQLTDLQARDLLNNLTNLKILYLWGNSLVTVHSRLFSHLTNLYKLDISRNRLNDLPDVFFINLTSLRELYISHNELHVLGKNAFQTLSQLENLDLSFNRLMSLPTGVFQHLYDLKALDLQGNQLTSIDYLHINDKYHLQVLNLAENYLTMLLTNMFSSLLNLTFIDISHNNLKVIPHLAHLKKLQILKLEDNKLSKVDKNTFNGIPFYASVTADQHEICDCFIPYVKDCTAIQEKSDYLTCDRLLSNKVLMVFTWLFGFCAIFGNTGVIIWRIIHFRKQHKVQSILLTNLAVSDLLMGIYLLLIASADVYFGYFFPMNSDKWRNGAVCRFASTLSIASSEASVLFVTLISIDRFQGIKFPYTTHKLRTKSTFILAGMIWTLAAAIGIIPSVFAGVNPNFYDNSHVCIGLPLVQQVIHVEQDYEEWTFEYWSQYNPPKFQTVHTVEGYAPGLYFSVAIFLGFNLLCFLIIAICYIIIIVTAVRTSKQSGRQVEMSDQLRLTSKVAAIVATDFCCWFPIIITGILVQTGAISINPSVFAWMVTFILPINSAINPYLYTLTNVISDCVHKIHREDSVQERQTEMMSFRKSEIHETDSVAVTHE